MPVNVEWKKKDPLMFIGLGLNGNEEVVWTLDGGGFDVVLLWWVSGDGRKRMVVRDSVKKSSVDSLLLDYVLQLI